jgi:hypothetical protein
MVGALADAIRRLLVGRPIDQATVFASRSGVIVDGVPSGSLQKVALAAGSR